MVPALQSNSGVKETVVSAQVSVAVSIGVSTASVPGVSQNPAVTSQVSPAAASHSASVVQGVVVSSGGTAGVVISLSVTVTLMTVLAFA